MSQPVKSVSPARTEDRIPQHNTTTFRFFRFYTARFFSVFQAVKFELAYALGFAERAPSNESPWNYARGFFRAGGRSYADFPEVKRRALALQVSPRLLR